MSAVHAILLSHHKVTSAFAPLGVDFDGANDWFGQTGAPSGLAAGKKGTISFWGRIDGGNGSARYPMYNATAGRFSWELRSDNKLHILGARGTAGSNATTLHLFSTTAYTSGAAWHHFIISYDLSDTGKRWFYVDDVSDLSVTTYNNNNIAYSEGSPDWQFSGFGTWNGALAEVFFHDDYIDLSVESNRRKFRDAGGHPVDLGTDGSTPFGVQPTFYCSVRSGGSVDDFGVNRGAGGDLTKTGSPALSSTNP